MKTEQATVDIFVSYAHEDRATAEGLARELRAKGWSVWWDPSIRTGKRFSQAIEEALQAARCVVVMWSGDSVLSDWVLDEAQVAKDRDVLFPIRISASSPPLGFRRIQTADLLGWDGEGTGEAFLRLNSHLVEMLGDPRRHDGNIARILGGDTTSRWHRLASPPADPAQMPWSYWMVRYIVADTLEALSDLIWSVGGSPPYGKISYDEAAAVYQLIEHFKGPGRAPERFYALVEQFAVQEPSAWRALESFRIFDRVASSPDSYTLSDLRIGGVDAVEVVDEPLRSYFDLLRAQLRYRAGDCGEAKELTLRAVEVLRAFAKTDAVYTNRLTQAVTNAASLCAMDGDFDAARSNATLLGQLGREDMLGNWWSYLSERPSFSEQYLTLAKTAREYLETGNPRAIECLLESERVAVLENRQSELPGLLVDLAAAFRRLGNRYGAIKTYRRAIEISQRVGNHLYMTRSCQNLASTLIEEADLESALPYIRAGIYSAVQSGDHLQAQSSCRLLDWAIDQRPELIGDAIEILDVAAKTVATGLPDRGARAVAGTIYHRLHELLEQGGHAERARETFEVLQTLEKAGTITKT